MAADERDEPTLIEILLSIIIAGILLALLSILYCAFITT